jgi:hypothetical protein
MARGTSATDGGGARPCNPVTVVCSGGRGWKKGVRKATLAEEGGGSDISARRNRRRPGHACGGRGGRLHSGSGIAGGSRLGERVRGDEGSKAEVVVCLAWSSTERSSRNNSGGGSLAGDGGAAGGYGGRSAGRGKEREGELAREREGNVVWRGAFCRQGWRSMGAERAALAACPGGAVIKLVTVTMCKAGTVAMCPSLTPCVASSRQN